MQKNHAEAQSAFQHCAAMYKQLYSIYPQEHELLQHQIEALIQLGEHEAAELLLDQLNALLQSKHEPAAAQQVEQIRRYVSQSKHIQHYYATPFLHLASKPLLQHFFSQHTRIQCKEGQYLMRFGDTDQQMYIVLSGELAVWSHDASGNKHFEHVLRAGEVIGELAFLDNTPRNADVLACSDCHLLAIPAKAVYQLFEKDPKIETTLRQEADIRKIQVAMKCCPVLAKLPQHLQRILAKEARVQQNHPLERIYRSGEPIAYIDLVCTGIINFISEHSDGSSLMLHVLKVGSLIGCSAATIQMDQTYSADVVSMSELTRIQFHLNCIKKACDLNSRLYQSILKQAEADRDNLLRHLTNT
ncbi:MAG: cyclic nucleotide-binding domain-containing protein [Ghiorsea sp.]|nr:cyclic nucleotide-binding domain-containing protein [Ghiorsea sp.]